METRLTSRNQERLIPALIKIRERAVELERALEDHLAQIEADYRDSARNLMHYLGVRQQDLRKIQDDL